MYASLTAYNETPFDRKRLRAMIQFKQGAMRNSKNVKHIGFILTFSCWQP
jgi:hypothetical protein